MIYGLVGIISLLVGYCVYVTMIARNAINLSYKTMENYERAEGNWLTERKDLYNRLMSRDLADYHHHTNKSDRIKVSKTNNPLQSAISEAYRKADNQ